MHKRVCECTQFILTYSNYRQRIHIHKYTLCVSNKYASICVIMYERGYAWMHTLVLILYRPIWFRPFYSEFTPFTQSIAIPKSNTSLLYKLLKTDLYRRGWTGGGSEYVSAEEELHKLSG